MTRDQRRLAAIVCADVVGYSRLMQRDESGTLARLKAHRRQLIDPKIAEYGGRIVKTTGDGLLVEFASVVDAVRCAVDVQRRMAERNASVPAENQIRFRVGVNVGDIIVDADDIFGDGVNVAARLQTLAEPGGVYVSRVVHDEVRDKVGVQFQDLGPLDLKNMAPIDAYRVEIDARAERSAAQSLATSLRQFASRTTRWWPVAVVAGLIGLAVVVWTTYRFALAPSAPVPYSAEDRRMTFAVMPFTADASDPTSEQVAAMMTQQTVARLDGDPLWAQVASPHRVEEALTRHAGTKRLATDIDVHFLLRGNVAPVSGGFNAELTLVDGRTERAVGKGSLVVGQGAWTPRARMNLGLVVDDLVNKAIEVEVNDARIKPDAALDVRDLTFRAFVEWLGRKRQRDEQGAYSAASVLLDRALLLAPDDRLALQLTAAINLCDCIAGWSRNPAEQHKIGEAALDKALRRDPYAAGMLRLKAELLAYQGKYEESLLLAESILTREPDRWSVLLLKAYDLLKLGKLPEAAKAIDDVLMRSDGPDSTILAAAIYFTLADYERSLLMAQSAKSQLDREELANPRFGAVVLTLAASQARLGQVNRARDVLKDFKAYAPGVDTISAVRKWIYPSAELAGFEPLYEGLRLAGMPD